MTITNVGFDSSEGAGVDEPHVSDAVYADAPDGRAITASCGCDSVCEGLHDLTHERPQSCPPQDGAPRSSASATTADAARSGGVLIGPLHRGLQAARA
jgi:hypothetical protein